MGVVPGRRVTHGPHCVFSFGPGAHERKHDAERADVQDLLNEELEALSAVHGNSHQRGDVHLRAPLFHGASHVGHTEEKRTQSLCIERAVLHVDEEEVQVGRGQGTGVLKGEVCGEQTEDGKVLLERLDCPIQSHLLGVYGPGE